MNSHTEKSARWSDAAVRKCAPCACRGGNVLFYVVASTYLLRVAEILAAMSDRRAQLYSVLSTNLSNLHTKKLVTKIC